MSTVSITSTQGGEPAAAPPDSRQSPSLAFGSSKIAHRHHERLAIVYVRQSDPQQVLQHRESKELQYIAQNVVRWTRSNTSEHC